MREPPAVRVRVVVAIAALLAMAAVIWLPILVSPNPRESPLPAPDSASPPLSPLPGAMLTILIVAVGFGIGALVITIAGAWARR